MKLSKDNVEMAREEYRPKFETIDFPKKLFQVEVNVPNFLYPTDDEGDVLYVGDKGLSATMNDSIDSYFPTVNNDKKRKVINRETRTDVILMSDKKRKTVKTQAVGEEADSNRARLGRPVRRKQNDIERLKSTIDHYTTGIKERAQIKLALEIGRCETTIATVDRMKQKKEHLKLDTDPLLCFSINEVMTLRPSGSSGGGRKSLWDTPTDEPRVTIKFGDAYSLDEIFETAVIMSDAYNEIARLIKPLSNDSVTVANDTKLERDYVGKFKTRLYKHAYLFYGRSDGSFTKYTCNPPSEDEIEKMVTDTGNTDSPSLEKAVSNTPNTDGVCVALDNDITTQPPSGYEVKKADTNNNCVTLRTPEEGKTCTPVIDDALRMTVNHTTAMGSEQNKSEDNTKHVTTHSKTDDMNEMEMCVAKTVSELAQAQRRSPRQRRPTERYTGQITHHPSTRRTLPMRRDGNAIRETDVPKTSHRTNKGHEENQTTSPLAVDDTGSITVLTTKATSTTRVDKTPRLDTGNPVETTKHTNQDTDESTTNQHSSSNPSIDGKTIECTVNGKNKSNDQPTTSEEPRKETKKSKCTVQSCPMFTSEVGIGSCSICDQLVHTNDACSKLRQLDPNGKQNDEDRVCVDCMKQIPSNLKTS
jgi:hypothetical protein